MSQSEAESYRGQQTRFSQASEYNALVFLISRILSKKHTATLVMIKACTNDGGVSAVGSVDVLPLVNQLDGTGNAVPHGMLYGLPYLRVQGGNNAVIMDPTEGDIGLCIFCERDISAVKAMKEQANPGSFRSFDMADGVYLGGLLNGTPTQYVQFTGTNINVVAPAVNISSNGTGLQALINASFAALFDAHEHPLDLVHSIALATATPIIPANLTTVLKAK